MDVAVGKMIYTMFLKYPNFDYSCLGDEVLELVAGYKQMASKGEITLEAPLNDDIRSILLDMNPTTNSEAAAVTHSIRVVATLLCLRLNYLFSSFFTFTNHNF